MTNIISTIPIIINNITTIDTRSYAAFRVADLDWIVGPGYSSGGNVLLHASVTQLGLDLTCFVIVISHPLSEKLDGWSLL